MPSLKSAGQKLINMPKIYEYLGLIFFFYANEHLPIHVHVSFAEFESKFELEFENGKLKNISVQKVKGRLPLPPKETKEAIKFIKKYHEGIVDKWTKFFVQNKKVTCEIINKKIK
jgi:hypothetical protein